MLFTDVLYHFNRSWLHFNKYYLILSYLMSENKYCTRISVGSRQSMIDMDSKRATTKCIATALVCQPCWISCYTLIQFSQWSLAICTVIVCSTFSAMRFGPAFFSGALWLSCWGSRRWWWRRLLFSWVCKLYLLFTTFVVLFFVAVAYYRLCGAYV